MSNHDACSQSGYLERLQFTSHDGRAVVQKPGTPARWRGAIGSVVVALMLVLLVAAQPAAAQETNPICSDDSDTLTNMIEGFIQLTTALGLVGLLVVWQADELAEMFMLNQEQKRGIKRHKIGALKSASVLVVLGPLFTVAGRVMDLPIAQCVDLVPL